MSGTQPIDPLASDSVEPRRKSRRTRGDIKNSYDVVVVGSGMGGLTAAALLAMRGKSVLVVESHYVAGGNATVFRRKQWEFDVGLHYIGDCAPGGTIPRILQACGVANVRFRPLSSELEQLHLPGRVFAVPSQRSLFKQRLLEAFPEEKKGIERYINFLKQCDVVAQADAKGTKLEKLASIAKSPLIVRYAGASLGTFLDSCTQNQALRAILTAQNGVYAVAPSRVSAVLHAGVQNHYFTSGGFYPEGGGQILSDRLVDAIEDAGGDVRLITACQRIEVESYGSWISKKRAVAVQLHNKHLGVRRISAKTIISNADLKRTISDLVGVEHFSKRLGERLLGYEMALPLFVVYLGLDIDPKSLPYENQNLWLWDSVDFERDYQALVRGEFPERPWIYISTASLKDPGNARIAPNGKTNLQIMTLAPSKPESWGTTPAQWAAGTYQNELSYKQRKAWMEARCIEQAERLIPGLRKAILFQESATPLTASRYLKTSDGSAYGFAAIPSQFLHHRPAAKSPIDSLYFCGTNCRAGHGIAGAMMSGLQAADAVLGGGLVRQTLRGKVASNDEIGALIGHADGPAH